MVPIEYRNVPSDYEIVGDFPTFVTVKLKGNSLILKKLSPQSIKVWIDLSSIHEGKNLINVKNVKVPEGVEVIRVTPSKFYISFSKVIKKQVRVVIRWKSKPKFKWRILPDKVTIRGRKEIVRKVKYLYTETVDPEVLKKEKKIDVKIRTNLEIEVHPKVVTLEVLP